MLKAIIVPVLCGSAYHNLGIPSLLNAISAYFPSPNAKEDFIIAKKKDGSESRIKVDSNDPLSALVFKTGLPIRMSGKMSYFKVFSGVMTPDTTVYNMNRDVNEKIGKIFTMQGKKQIEVECLKQVI